MSDSNERILEVNGKVDHGIMSFDFFKTNEALKKWKNNDFIFLQTLKAKKQGFYFFANFKS